MACPQSIIIVGSGVFGLSTAYAMTNDDGFAQTSIALVDGWDFEPSGAAKGTSVGNPRAANYDTSRVIRSEYPHGAYATLAREAHRQWRGPWGESGRYVEQRLLMCAQGSPLRAPKKPGETINYVKNAYELSCKLSTDGLQVLDSLHRIRAELGVTAPLAAHETEEAQEIRGYISRDSGRADSGATMEWLRQKVIQSGRVQTLKGYVQSLIRADRGSEARGVRLDSGIELFADLTIVAAGSHTPRLLGIDTLCDVYSEVVAYIRLSSEECHHFKRLDMPIIVNATRCVFAISPDNEGFLKLGKFSHSGLVDVRQCAGIDVGPRSHRTRLGDNWNDPQFGWGCDVDMSEDLDGPTQATLTQYRAFLKELFSSSGIGSEGNLFDSISERPFAKIRRCWYTDTPSTDFIIDYHPASAGTLFVASGGSDHAFKFLPVIGEKIAGIVLRGRGVPCTTDDDANLTSLRESWRFPRTTASNF